MGTRVDVKPELFEWAIERARLDLNELLKRFPQLQSWMAGEERPTFKQLEKFSAATHAPLGFFFLPKPPRENLPVADFRTLGGAAVESPSADLLDTIYVCQQRQEWYRDFSRSMGERTLPFIGTMTPNNDIVAAAREIRQSLGFTLMERKAYSSWSEALRHLVRSVSRQGFSS